MIRRFVTVSAFAAGGVAAFRLIAKGAITVDVGLGRRVRPLGPRSWRIAAPRDVVFAVIADPYLRRTPVGLKSKLAVWERSADMALAAHFTEVRGFGVTTTVETVRFDEPRTIAFRLLRGPVPHVTESFELAEVDGECELTWSGELGTDFGGVGAWWGDRVARQWEEAVERSIESITAEAERRSRPTAS